MPGRFYQQSGVESYDRAAWAGWMPEVIGVVRRPGMNCLVQRTPRGATGASEVDVSAASAAMLLFWTKGQRVSCRLDGRPYALRARPWQFTLCPAGIESWWLNTPEASDGVLHLHLDRHLMDEAAQGAMMTPGALPVLAAAEDRFLEAAARWVQAECLHAGEPPGLLWDSIAATLAYRLLRIDRPPEPGARRGGLAPRQVTRVTDYLEAHLADDVALADLAALVGLSSSHLCRAFKAATGLPPHRWRIAQRVARARELLQRTDLPVTQIAGRVGYDDPGQFAVVFRKSMGATPTAYRRMLKA